MGFAEEYSSQKFNNPNNKTLDYLEYVKGIASDEIGVLFVLQNVWRNKITDFKERISVYEVISKKYPEDFFDNFDAIKDPISKEEMKEILILITKNCAEINPNICFKYFDQWKDTVSLEARNEILELSAENCAKNYPTACFNNFKKWENVASPERRNEILKLATKNCVKERPVICYDYFDVWKNSVTEEEMKEILVTVKEKTSPKEFEIFIEYHPEVAPILNKRNKNKDPRGGSLYELTDDAIRGFCNSSITNSSYNIVSTDELLINLSGVNFLTKPLTPATSKIGKIQIYIG